VVDSATGAAPTVGIRAGREGTDTLLGVSLEIPLFVRNDFKAGVRVASYEASVAQQAYQVAYRRAQARLNGSLGRYQNTKRAWNVWVTEGQEAQREQVDLLDKMWQAGELTATDYLIQAKQSIDTQKAATLLMGEVWQAKIAWLDASGQVTHWLKMPTIEQAMTTHKTDFGA
jgi:cobalt-zinc-cadmium efflux system outer membrane protein